jgi:hypothetical protein
MSLAVALAAALGLTLASPAMARPAKLLEAGASDGHVTARWSLPDGVRSQFVEVANNPNTNRFGYFQNPARGGPITVVSFNVVDDNQLSFTDKVKLPLGTYWVHIASNDTLCADSCPSIEFSSTFEVQITAAGKGSGKNIGGGSDSKPPVQTVSYKRVQRLKRLYVTSKISEDGTVRASGSVGVPGTSRLIRFKAVSRSAKANQKVKLRLRLSKANLRAAKRALRHGRRLRANITVTGLDAAGYSTTKKVRIRLRR